MRIQVLSDVHCEFGRPPVVENDSADVLVLAGDICTARRFSEERRFVQECAEKFPWVVYIMGNHEHYKHVFNKTAEVIREGLSEHKNVYFLDNESITIDSVRFVGSTLWASMNNGCPLTMNHLLYHMNDFKVIKYRDSSGNYFKFNPQVAWSEHTISCNYIAEQLRERVKTVVVTHHAPSFRSINPIYAKDVWNNGAYASDLEHLMGDHVPLWIHGHTHTAFDYMVNGTRVVCNPVGYPGEKSNPNLNFIVEV